MWMYLRNTPCDVVLGSVYIPCENSKHYSDELFQNLLSDIALIEGKFKAPIIVAGDFNARTGSMSDVIAEDIASGSVDGDIHDNICDSLERLQLLGIDVSRHNQDTVCNKNGYQLIDCCRTADLKIVNGRFGSDARIGSFTCTNVKCHRLHDRLFKPSSPYQ